MKIYITSSCHKATFCQVTSISAALRMRSAAICGFHVMAELHQDICSATWWDSKLFNALIHPKLWLEPPGDCRVPHQQQPAPFINLMGFIFLTLAIYQAEAGWWGERGGSNSPTPAPSQQGNLWFMVPLPFPITLSGSLLFPSLPAVVRLLFLLSTHLRLFVPHSLWLFPAPHSSALFPLLHFLFLFSLSFSPSSSPSPLLSLLNFPLLSLCCVTGLWGRWLPVHHQGDNYPHGKLQLPCLWLWRPISDTCAAGEWSVVAHFLLTVVGELSTKCFSFVCAPLWLPSEGNFLLAASVYSEEHLQNSLKGSSANMMLIEMSGKEDIIFTLRATLSYGGLPKPI